jgi:hypothetical protein
VKTAELSGVQLDYWVAHIDKRCGGLRFEWRGEHWVGLGDFDGKTEVVIAGAKPGFRAFLAIRKQYGLSERDIYQPSRDWAHGGPIIEREGIQLWPDTADDQKDAVPGVWFAAAWQKAEHQGATPLEAAMRAYVASKFGEEVTP